MFTSFSTALSALNAFSTAVDVVGNNLANLDTTGYKASTVYFRDLVTQSLGTGLGETQVGFGTGTPVTIRQFTQGALESSTGLLDAAISGDGFFIVKNSAGNTLYTRAGSFTTDASGNLLTATGEKVQGWTALNADGTINTNGEIGDIVVPVGETSKPSATTEMTESVNLNSSATVGSTSDFSTSVTVYDSLGTSHTMTLTFEKTADATWSCSASIPAADSADGTTTAVTTVPSTIEFTFNSDGTLDTSSWDATSSSQITFTLPTLADGAADSTVSWSPVSSTGATLTQYDETSASSSQSTDGNAPSELTKVTLGDGGTIMAVYADGTEATVGQLALASIRNPSSLIAVGNNEYETSSKTATPSVGVPGTGGRGSVLGGELEYSTVDIAAEFTSLIVLQRGYQANSKVITTVDEMSQYTINLKQ
jgi:flagellar hook protein FlgE